GLERAAVRARAREDDLVLADALLLAPDEFRLAAAGEEDVPGDRAVLVPRDRPTLLADVLADERRPPVGRDLHAGFALCSGRRNGGRDHQRGGDLGEDERT